MDSYGRPAHPRQTIYPGAAGGLHQEYQRRPQTLVLQKPCVPLAIMLVHLLVVLIVLLVFVWADHEDSTEKYLGGLNFGTNLFNWHPVFMTWGFSCLLEGVLCYRSLRFTPHRRKRSMHATWVAVGVFLLSCGLAVVFKYKHKNHLASLYSTHSWLGIFTVTLIFAQFLLGFCVYAVPGVRLSTKQHVYPLHASLGLAATVFAAAAVLSGIDHENTLLGCAYSVVNKDLDPALHYDDIPAGCRVSNGIAVMVMCALLLSVYALTNLKSASAASEDLKAYRGAGGSGGGGGGGSSGGGSGGGGSGEGWDEPPERVYYGTHLLPGGRLPPQHADAGEDSVSSLQGFEEPTAQLQAEDEGAEEGFEAFGTEGSRLLS